MLPFYLTQEKENKTIFHIAKEHDETLNCKNYKVVPENDTKSTNCINVKAKRIDENMVHLHIEQNIYLTDTSEIFAIIAQKISEINLGNVIPTSMSQNNNSAIVFFQTRGKTRVLSSSFFKIQKLIF